MATENAHTSNIQTERVTFRNIYVCVYKYEKTMTGKRDYKFEGKMEKEGYVWECRGQKRKGEML